jgi:SAM-dependent methyltransferase
MTKKVFDGYSHYYDILYRDKDYQSESEYILSLINTNSLNAKTVLELGSGTGIHAECLASYGFSVHGIDLSAGMIDKANKRKESLPNDISNNLIFETGDIRNVRTGEKYDVVISLFHVMSYQTTNEDLNKVFETAAIHLKPGGIFIFDYWFGPCVLAKQPSVKIKKMKDEFVEILRIAEPELFPNRNTVNVDFTVFISDTLTKKENEVIKESHLMRFLFIPELELLNDKFKLVDTYAWMTLKSPTINNWAAISIMKMK